MADKSHSGTPDRREGGNTLPEGWISACYGDVYLSASNGTGGSQNKDGVGIPVSRIETIANEEIDYDRIGYLASFDEVKVEKHKLLQGDILFSHINSPIHLGKTAIYDGENTLYHGINLLRIIVNREAILPEIFNWHCKYTRGQGEFSLRAQHAVNQSSLNQKKLSEFEIPLPPLAEQKVIAEKLDTLLAQVDTTKARLERIPDIIKRFRQSVLAAAVSGKLTEEWRENSTASLTIWNGKFDPDSIEQGMEPFSLPDSWCWDNLGNTVSIHNSKRVPLKQSDRDKRSGQYPYYGAFGVIDDIDDYLFDGRYVLLAEDGKNLESRSRPIALIADGKFWVNNHAHVISMIGDNSLDYLCLFLNSPTVLIDEFLTGQDQVKLNRKAMELIPIPVPSFEEQTEIVRRVEELFAFADSIEQKAAAALERVNNLTQSILAKAFRGELTADWRAANPELISDDNSAEALLAKIQAEREALKPVKKTRKKKAKA